MRIVVLPFENLGPAEDEYFADGISEEITSRLATLDGLATISRASARKYKGNRPSTDRIGEELGVDYILEGTVRWEQREDAPSRVRVIPELIRVADDTSVWSARYHEDLDRIFAVQSDIAEAVARQLDLTLVAGDREALEARPTEDMEAYQAYLRAMELWNQPGFHVPRFELTAELFERAVGLDPQNAHVANELGRTILAQRRFEEANELFARAVTLAPQEERVWRTRAWALYLQTGDAEAAREILEDMPGLWPGDRDLVILLWRDREWKMALDRLKLAVPGSEASGSALAWAPYRRGLILERLGRNDEAREQFEEALESTSLVVPPETHFLEAFTHAKLGNETKAVEAFEEGSSALPSDLGLDAFDRSHEERRADFLTALGRHDGALDLLEDLLQSEYDFPVTRPALRSDPWYDPLRENPRFQALVR